MTPSTTSTVARPPSRREWWPSTHRTLISGSSSFEGTSSGRSPTWRARSATRADRLADRTEAKVAAASTSVPAGVASGEIGTHSAIAGQGTPALPAGGREVHQVRRRPPGAAPGPADGGEGGGHDVAAADHAGAGPGPVQVGAGQLGQDEVAAPVRVLERVDVHGQAVGMGRPAGLLAGGPAHEGGRVVAVAGGVGLQVSGGDEPHLLDGEPGPVEAGEHRDHAGGDAL